MIGPRAPLRLLTLATLAMLALAALLALVPTADAATPYAVSATLTPPPEHEGAALQVHTVSYDATGPIRWSRFVPDGSTFLRAYDEDGRALSATVQDGKVVLETRERGRHSYSLEFSTPVERHGPLMVVVADVSAASDSPTRASLSDVAIAQGHTLVGWRGSDGAELADDGVFRAVGPMRASFAIAPPGIEDAGPDARTSGTRVVREAFADVHPDRIDVRTVLVYDTDTYGPDWTLSVPMEATDARAETPWGPVPCEPSAEGLACTAPYPFAHHLGPRNLTLSYTLPAPSAHGGAFRSANVSISAAPDSYVTLNVTLPPDWTHTGTRAGAAHEPEPLRYVSEGPLAVSVGLLPPPGPDEVRFEEGVFVVQVAEELAERARRVAATASDLLPSAAGFVGGGSIDRPFALAYTDAPVFDWEEGFYSPGYDTISIRANDLREHPDKDFHAVRTLVHETTHGLVSRHLPDAPGGTSFFDEGLARLAETHVESVFADDVFDCRTQGGRQTCTRDSARPEADTIHAFHRDGKPLPLTWSADEVDAQTRGFLYDYSGYVFHAYERRTEPGALTHVLNRLAAQTPEGDETAQAFIDRVVAALRTQAPDLPLDAILYPGRSVATLNAEEFAACLGPLAAPPYPWETLPPRPGAGCGDLDLQSGPGEPAPQPAERPLPEPPEAPPRLELPPAPDEEPLADPPATDGGGTSGGVDGRSPGAVADDGRAPPAFVPLPGAPFALVALVAAAVWAGRARGGR